MPAAELQAPFSEMCLAEGIELISNPVVPRLTNRGHAALDAADDAEAACLRRMSEIFSSLRGDEKILYAKRPRALVPDFLLTETGHLVELDEEQHFTSARLETLKHYEGLSLPWDVAEYRSICETWRARGDKAFRHKQAKEFPGELGRQRQRAYFDAVRDVMAGVVSGTPGVLRIAVPHRDLELGVKQLKRQIAETRN